MARLDGSTGNRRRRGAPDRLDPEPDASLKTWAARATVIYTPLGVVVGVLTVVVGILGLVVMVLAWWYPHHRQEAAKAEERRPPETVAPPTLEEKTEGAATPGEQPRLDTERRRQAEREEAARAERAFRDRYVNGSALGQLDGGHVTVAVSDDSLERSIAQALRERGVAVSTNLLSDQVFDGSVLPRLAAGDRALLDRLALGNGRATLLLGEIDYEPSAPTGFGNTVNLRGHLSVHIVPLSGGVPISLPTLSEVGAGFSEEQARSVLVGRLVEALLEERVIAKLSS